jgi:hypothetical protein
MDILGDFTYEEREEREVDLSPAEILEQLSFRFAVIVAVGVGVVTALTYLLY